MHEVENKKTALMLEAGDPALSTNATACDSITVSKAHWHSEKPSVW